MGRPPSIPVEKKTEDRAERAGRRGEHRRGGAQGARQRADHRPVEGRLPGGRQDRAGGRQVGPLTGRSSWRPRSPSCPRRWARPRLRSWGFPLWGSVEEERGGPAGPFEDLEVIRMEAGGPPLGEHADREVLQADRRARTHLAAPVGQGPGSAEAEGPLAAAGAAWRGPRRGDRPRPGTPGVGAPQGVGDGPPRRARGVAGDRAAGAAGRGLILPASCQRERRRLAQRRKAAFAAEPTAPNLGVPIVLSGPRVGPRPLARGNSRSALAVVVLALMGVFAVGRRCG